MKLLIGQISPVLGDVSGNLKQCLDAVTAGEAAGVDLVVLPELALCGYPPRDLLLRTDLLDACDQAIGKLTRWGVPVLVGAPHRERGRLYNAAFLLAEGGVVTVGHKCLLPTYDVFDEKRYFEPSSRALVATLAGQRVGITICEDIWNAPNIVGDLGYRHDPIDDVAGCDVVINLSASPYHTGKVANRFALLQDRARQADAPVVYCNMAGGNDELLFDGTSMVVRPDGALLMQGARFEPEHRVVDLAQEPTVFTELAFEDATLRALTMGVRDYAARCGFTTALVGLSGGIDSALVVAIAAQALGPENVYCLGMPGPYSSEGSVTDARQLAQNLGVSFALAPIAEIHDAFLRTLNPHFSGQNPDVTEENLQARARGSLLMAMSNKFGHLLLTTGNKSEMAVGYCTLYGDMNGGLAVIADVLKTDVYRLCRWLNRNDEVIPWPIIDKPPSAELAPDQTDQDSLPPYEQLDAILKLYVEGLVTPSEIINQGHPEAVVERIVGLVQRSEYKRWQAAPGLRVTAKAFGSGRRIPLAKRWSLDV